MGFEGIEMTEQQRRQLGEEGFVVLEGAMGADLLRGLRDRIAELVHVMSEGVACG